MVAPPTSSSSTFPTLSYAQARNDPSAFLPVLRNALLTTGFFYLDHIQEVVPDWESRWSDLFRDCATFFGLSSEEKEKCAMKNSRHFRGFSAVGAETTQGKTDLREQIDLGPHTETVVDYPPTAATPVEMSLYGPNLYPAHPQTFQTSIETYRELVSSIAKELVKLIARSVTTSDSSATHFASLFEGTESKPDYSRMKVVHYPKKSLEPGLGVGAHKDGGGLTLLAQDATGGLQVQRWDGEWVGVEPKPFALVINIGQVIERLSQSRYLATTHRVLPPERSRISIPFFYSPALTSTLTPLDPSNLIDLEGEERTEISEVRKGDLHEEVFGRAAWRGITRSHHEVWRKYYERHDTLGGPEKA